MVFNQVDLINLSSKHFLLKFYRNQIHFKPDDNANRNLELNRAWYSNGPSSPNPTNVYPTKSFTGKSLSRSTQKSKPKLGPNSNSSDVRLPMKCCGGTLARYCHNSYDSFRWVIVSSTFKTKTIPCWIMLTLHWRTYQLSRNDTPTHSW